MRNIERNRDAYERGVKEERHRVARDLHDDASAVLLTALHKNEIKEVHSAIREAMAEIRTIATGLVGERLSLDEVLAALRHETGPRLEAAGIACKWAMPEIGGPETGGPGFLLDYTVYRNLVSAHRELVSNIIRHSGASCVWITVELDGGDITLTVRDDGVGLADNHRPGDGLANIRRRIASIGGSVSMPSGRTGLAVRLNLPLGEPA